jgi:hypothetical protein
VPKEPIVPFTPRLTEDPGDGVGAVLGLGHQEVHVAFRAKAAATILIDDRVTLIDDRVTTRREPAALAEQCLRLGLVVGRAVEEHGPRSIEGFVLARRQIHVGGEADAVTHGQQHVLNQMRVELRARRQGGGIKTGHVGGALPCVKDCFPSTRRFARPGISTGSILHAGSGAEQA